MNSSISFKKSLDYCLNSEKVTELINDVNILPENIRDSILKMEEDLLRKINTELDEIEKNKKSLVKSDSLYKKSKLKSSTFKIIIRLFIISILVSIFALSSKLFNFPFYNSLPNLHTYINSNLIFSSILISFFVLLGLVILFNVIHKSKIGKIENYHKTNENGKYYIEKRIEELVSKTEKKLNEKIIIPEILLLINSLSKPNYNTEFEKISINSLTNDYNAKYEIATEELLKMGTLLENMNSGTIGISGPRGIGKSTLLKSFYSATSRVINGKKVLPIIANAPVKYEIREFTVHIFSQVINKFIENENDTITDDSIIIDEKPLNKRIKVISNRIKVAAMMIGVLMIMLNILLNSIDAKTDTPEKNDKTEATIINAKQQTLYEKYNLIIWGGILFFVSFSLSFPVPMFNDSKEETTPDEDNSIINLANRWKKKLKFQMSYTSGWSGNLKSSVGIEAGISSSVSLAQNQLSFPEIVHGFKSFIERINDKYKIIIAIDELDKIHSYSDLDFFLNEIKALFDINECVFLISISEEALLNFENRELQIKDVLDSTFDEIIRLKNFDFIQSKNLIQKRILGLPLPFISFIYLYTRGIPREMLRLVRKIAAYNSDSNKVKLDSVINEIIINDIKTKLNTLLKNSAKNGYQLEYVYYENILNSNFIQDLSWESLDVLESNIKTTHEEKKEKNKTAIPFTKLRAYILYMKSIGVYLKNTDDFKTIIEDNLARDYNEYCQLGQLINYNPTDVIKKINMKKTGANTVHIV